MLIYTCLKTISILLTFALNIVYAQYCLYPWEINSLSDSNTPICPVLTASNLTCTFPFSWNGMQYKTCIITGPSNPDYLPQCITTANTWSFCNVPTNAVVFQVTTRKAGNYWNNGASMNGGTLVYISGKRFAPNIFSTTPTSAQANLVVFVNSYASFVCEIHPDKTTATQITCYTSPMPIGSYLVRVLVYDELIPMYQYTSQSYAYVQVTDSNTPKITSLSPRLGLPGSFVTINGDFKTICYTRDDSTNDAGVNCGDDSVPRILRVYFGSQICELIDSNTNQLFANLTQYSMYCQLQKPEVNYFTSTVLVSNEYGRSLAAANMLYVSPDENLYHFQTFAEINDVTPRNGSIIGGTFLKISGKYFYSDDNVPASIEVGGQECILESFDMTNLPLTTLVCKTPEMNLKAEYFGNRGITLIRDNVLTSFANLSKALPSSKAQTSILNQASYQDTQTVSVTIWLKGFIFPKRDSDYEFSIVTNGVAALFISNDSSSANKSLIASTFNQTTLKGKVTLKAYQNYFFQAVASRSSGLSLVINGKMFSTSLTNMSSTYVTNEVQEIEISSNIFPESYNISYGNLNASSITPVSEVQTLTIIGDQNALFMIDFNGVSTTYLYVGANASQIQDALNDLPNLSPNLVNVTESLYNDEISKIYKVSFSSDLGDVPMIKELTGNVNALIEEQTKGVASGSKIQLVIQNVSTNLFSLNDTSTNIKTIIDKSLGIRCPQSVINSPDMFLINDYESSCTWDGVQSFNNTAFCGKCSLKNSNVLFTNLNSTLDYKYVCFAYKLTQPITTVSFQVIDPLTGTLSTFATAVSTIADFQWRYICADLYFAYMALNPTSSYPPKSLKVYQATINPATPDIYIDVVSVRNSLPLGYNDGLLSTSRRLYPSLQIPSNKFTLTKTTSAITISYQPANCASNLDPAALGQSYLNVTLNQISRASPSVTGSFGLNWNKDYFEIPATISSYDLKNILQSFENFGYANIYRTKDCYGYKWRIVWINGGNKPTFIINSTSLYGASPSIKVTVIQDGGVSFNPITDDMLRTYHTKPQVTVSINNIMSKCSNSCDFEWSELATPIVTSIDASLQQSIKLYGSNFDSDPKKNLVFIGDVICNVTSASFSQLTCTPGENSVGQYKVIVNVYQKGSAIINTTRLIEFKLNASLFTPTISGTGGGLRMNIFGFGFNSKTFVKIDNIDCSIISVDYTSITCLIPPNPTDVNKYVDVVVMQGGFQSILLKKFFYDADSTSIVTSVYPYKLSVLGEEIINIDGTNLPLNPESVMIGNQPVDILNSTNTQLIIKSKALAPGLYDLIIPAKDLGNAKVNTKIEYVLYVTSFSPNAGSIRGGTYITVYGNGFSQNCSLNQVSFGPQPCKVISCDATWIKCETSSAYLTYQVNNSASDPYYGKGYAWNEPFLILKAGDTIKWSWQSPVGISTVRFKVEQVEDPSSVSPMGFTSGDQTASGSYSYQFNQPGWYYYWSGYVEPSGQISFRGVVFVEESIDVEFSVNVNLNGFDAQKCNLPFKYKDNVYTACTNTDMNSNWCSPTFEFNGQILECDPLEAQPLFNDTCSGLPIDPSYYIAPSDLLYDMLFTTLGNNLPSINNVSAVNVSINDEITVTGAGFSSIDCENQVLVNGVECPLVSNSINKLVCKFSNLESFEPNVYYNLEVRIKNLGYALPDNNFAVKFVPIISSLYPNIGSTSGGTQIKIKGFGFNKYTTTILIGSTYYYRGDTYGTQIFSDTILITTNSEKDGSYDLIIYTSEVLASCRNTTCAYTFSTEITPTIDSVLPSIINDSSLITLTGNNYGTDMSKLNIMIGSQKCRPISVSNTNIMCQLDGLNIGNQNIKLIIDGIGNSKNSNSSYVTGIASVSSISPLSGSIYGGTMLSINGNGFDTGTQIYLSNVKCNIVFFTINNIKCLTGSSIKSTVNIIMNNSINGIKYPTANFNFTYNTSFSPVISSISPTQGLGGLLTLNGTGFGSNPNNVVVNVGSKACLILTVSSTQVTCQLSANQAGTYNVTLRLISQGNSNSDKVFKYDLKITSLSNSQGIIGGGLNLTISGQGFSLNSQVLICNNTCKVYDASLNSISCTVPPANITNSDSVCELSVTESGVKATTSFAYSFSMTPQITFVYPLRGGTGGGTKLKINVTNLKASVSQISVTIAGTACDILSFSNNQIECQTGAYSYSSIKALVQLFISNYGFALNNGVQFEYIDLWSSKWTWGGLDPPAEGEIAVIGQSQQVYFDATTPILKGLIIQGGSLIFDDNQDVNLNVEYIIITDGGKFQIGSRDKPFLHKAIITMYGSVRSIELPIFGSKVLGLRNGTIDMHGARVGVTWTHLDYTALAGSDSITLKEPVNWIIGSEIIIATTGDKFSQGQSELRKIVSKSADNKTLSLDQPLNYAHLGEKRTVGTGSKSIDVYLRAEVGLLTRNVVFQGYNDQTWAPLLTTDACPDGFDPAEFAVQTCFLGRYGPELGTDQFGATLMINGAIRKANEPESVIARLSNVEFFHVGQAFRLGRYPIHFHMNGDMPSSYVTECSIHESFNRAVNIHASNYLRVERTVIYNIFGGAFFLEDGIEIGNVFDGNLAVFVRTSSSLLNEDVTPAAFWATNPNNTFKNNAVAGGTHFGFWYRLLNNPDGPSFTSSYCPIKIPFGTFFNNSVHSTGRFGLWIFPGYAPTVSGSCSDSRPSVARFYSLISWSNDKGAEWVQSNSIQFRNFIVWDQFTEGIASKTITQNQNANTQQSTNVYSSTFYNNQTGCLVSDSIIIGNSSNTALSNTPSGLVLAWDRGLLINNVSFYNFPQQSSQGIVPTVIIGRCLVGCGGWTTVTNQLSFYNVAYKTTHRWNWDVVLKDLDGSLSGSSNGVIVSRNNITINSPNCANTNSFYNGIACSNTNTWIRYAWNNFNPGQAVLINITNAQGQMVTTPLLSKRLTHPKGFMVALEAKNEYNLIIDLVAKPVNISYTGTFYGFIPGDYLIIKHKLYTEPDQVQLFGSNANRCYSPLSYSSNLNGDWYWDNDTSTLSYILMNTATLPFLDYPVTFSAIKCYYVGCQPPQNPSYKPPITSRPATALFWSNASTWSFALPGYGGYLGNNKFGLPKDNDTVLIPEGKYVVCDIQNLPKLKNLQIEGVLEFDNKMDHYLEVDMILINGGQLIIGWENDPILTNVTIVLTGEKDSLNYRLPNGLDQIGGKGIGVYGGLDLHGQPRNIIWTTLNQTANAGSNKIKINQAVDWQIGEQILVSTTSFVANQTEIFTIANISQDRLTLYLNSNLKYSHLGYYEYLPNGAQYKIAASVGLLTRNLKIIGGQYASQESDMYGFRIIVSVYSAMVNGVLLSYKGYARISNVQMIRPGQYEISSADNLDSNSNKYGIIFSILGAFNKSRPSYLRNSSFYYGYSCAIGVFFSTGIPIENNVIYRTLGYGMRIEGSSNIIRNNLVCMNYWPMTFIVWQADYDNNYYGAIDVHASDSVILEDNFVAGAERIGINFRGDLCTDGTDSLNGMNHSIARNTVYSALGGVVILPLNAFGFTCIRISGFTVFKSSHWGIYYQASSTVVASDNILIDNQISLFTFIIGPSSLSHELGAKKATIQNSLLVGQSPTFDCKNDTKPNDLNFLKAKTITSFGAGSSKASKIGLVWPNFLDGSNGAPFKPWSNIKTYNQINGIQNVINVTFAYFGTDCNGEQTTVISNSLNNDDGQHPVLFKTVKLYYVNDSSKIWLHRPNLDKINPSDCVDMDCDGLKKNLLVDLDGSFLGTTSSVISQSEYEWGSQQRGLGNFRIPKEALAAPNGTMLDPSTIYSTAGIVRDKNLCVYKSDWQAYQCQASLVYKMLVIESMDNDTETRRLSPVAIISDNGYLDLINGPQDHGWCAGYTCQKRISTFLALVVANRSYDIYLTSTTPEKIRFRILNADSSFKIRLSLYYSTSRRVDLYKNEVFVLATNGYYSNGNLLFKSPGSDISSYMPSHLNQSGVNFFSQNDKKMYFSIDGTSCIDLRVAPVLYVRFGLPALTQDQFFNTETLVGNFALLLGVPPSKIRRVEIVRASSKKKRSTDLSYISLTLYDDAATSLNDTSTITNSTAQMNELAAKVSNLYSTGQLQKQAESILNVTLSTMSVQQPVVNATLQTVAKVSRIVVQTKASKCSAQTPCLIQPVLKVVDENGNLASNIGNSQNPWTIQAQVNSSSNPNTKLILQTQATVVDGYANFTQLGISDFDDSVIINYNFATPLGVNQSTFDPLNVRTDPIKATRPELTCLSSESTVTANENEAFNLTLLIVDKFTLIKIPNITWNNLTWRAQLRMHNLGYFPAKGVLNITNSNATFDSKTGSAVFSNLVIDKAGMYLIKFNVSTNDNSYNSECYSNLITIKPASSVTDISSQSSSPDYLLKFEGNYNSINPNEIIANVYNYVSDFNLKIKNISCYAGSVYVAIFSSNYNPDLLANLATSGLNVSSSLSYASVTFDGTTFSCVNCSIAVAKQESQLTPLSIGLIVGSVVGFLIIFTLGILLGFKLQFLLNTPKVVSPAEGDLYYRTMWRETHGLTQVETGAIKTIDFRKIDQKINENKVKKVKPILEVKSYY